MGALRNKSILVGVTGSIAAYKAAEIVRLLRKREAVVYPVMTEAATHFLPPLTLQNLASQKVALKLFNGDARKAGHLSLAELADACLIAPTTANMIGKIASGIADDILTTTVLATKAPVLLAPAMNSMMYENRILQRNIGSLKSIGFKFIGPERGGLADGKIGLGRMTEPQEIVGCLDRVIRSSGDFLGKTFVVTAGPTREPLDRVRFLSNYSSGKMGYALAQEGASRGARIVLISGPTSLDPPSGVEFHWVESAREMYRMVGEKMGEADGIVMNAAVSDYAPVEKENGKIKKTTKKKFILELAQNPDILKELGHREENKILVGFCVETKDLEREAYRKLKKKNLDLIVANNIVEEGAGFESDTNIVTLMNSKGKVEHLSKRSKREVARAVWNEMKELMESKGL